MSFDVTDNQIVTVRLSTNIVAGSIPQDASEAVITVPVGMEPDLSITSATTWNGVWDAVARTVTWAQSSIAISAYVDLQLVVGTGLVDGTLLNVVGVVRSLNQTPEVSQTATLVFPFVAAPVFEYQLAWSPVWLPSHFALNLEGDTVTNISPATATVENRDFAVGTVEIVGKRYWEIQRVSGNSVNTYPGIVSAAQAQFFDDDTPHYFDGFGWISGRFLSASGTEFSKPNWSGSGTDAGVLMFAMDTDTGEIWVGQNGDWLANTSAVTAGPNFATANKVLAVDNPHPAVRARQSQSSWKLNDRATTLVYTPPLGYLPIQD